MENDNANGGNRQGCVGCLTVIVLIIAGIGWYGWSQYQQIRLVMDLAEGKVELPWEVTAVYYFGAQPNPEDDTDAVMDRLEIISAATGGTSKEAFECAVGICNFLEMGRVRVEPAVVLQKMADSAGSLPAPVPCEQFMRGFIQRHYPEAERRMVDRIMNN
jgi:hypothetical protein